MDGLIKEIEEGDFDYHNNEYDLENYEKIIEEIKIKKSDV